MGIVREVELVRQIEDLEKQVERLKTWLARFMGLSAGCVLVIVSLVVEG